MPNTLPQFTLDVLCLTDEFVRDIATAILPSLSGFDDVWTIANRVYDQHSPQQIAA